MSFLYDAMMKVLGTVLDTNPKDMIYIYSHVDSLGDGILGTVLNTGDLPGSFDMSWLDSVP